jgi:hypothetical protein
MTDFKKGGPLQNSNIFATNRLFVKNKLFKKRKKKRAPGVYNPKAKFKYEDGGEKDYIELDLSEEDVQKYIDGGYIVEEVSDPSIATLNRFIDGGSTDCPPGYKWDGKKCVEDPFMQGLMSRMRQGNQSKKSIPALTRKGSKQPVNNSFSNKALLNKEIKQKRNKDAVLQKTFPEVTITGTKTGHMPESFGENVAEFFDPTGYLSWGDAKNAYSDWQESGMDLPTWRQAADMFGAVPALGKFGKLKYLDPSSIKTLYKTIPWQQVINIGDTGEDIDSDNLNQKRNGGALEKLKPGGANKGCPPGTYWNGTKCTKLVTLKNDKKYIDGVANWAMHSADPNAISSEYNDQIKDRLYSGKWGFDPESGALVRLDKIQPQSVTKVDDKTKASREKEKLAEKNYYADIENKKAYKQSIEQAGFDPATFGKAKGTNVITGEPIYASSKEEADRINQEAINQAAIEGHAAVVNNPVFKTAAYMTPVGMAIGTIEGLTRLAPDAYDFVKDPSWSGAGQVAMDALELAPFAGKAIKNAYKINPWAFKEDPNKFYRQIGNKGLEDALNTGVIKSADQATYPRPYFVEGKDISMLEQTGSGAHGRPTVMFETSGVNKEGMPFVSPANASGEYTPWIADMGEVPVSEGRLLKQHWLKGYKEVPTELPGSPNASISGRLKQFFDRPPGPMMLLGPSGGTTVKKNINYYKQLLDSYDSKKMSAANKKFYNDLINTANKQDGMLTEAQVRELDRLKTGNFDYGKKGYAKGGATDDYIELDIPEEEIQKYIAQGYIVEPVSKLKKFIS